LPLSPSRVILLVPEDRGADHQESSKAHSRRNAALRHRGSPCHAGTSKAHAANKEATRGPPAPQSTHYPILLLAFGNNPDWSLRVGQKGPERLDRPNYPPIPLEPATVAHETAADSWTYQAKDSATGAALSVHLTREACTDAASDPTAAPRPSTGKYPFSVSVDHAQLGSMKGCARIAAELFPKINNQPDAEDDIDKNKPPPPTITKFKPPVAMAYLNSAGSIVLSRGGVKKIIAPAGTELSLSHDGKKLLYTRSDSKAAPDRTIVLYDADSGKSQDLVRRSRSPTFLVARRLAHRLSSSAESILASLVLPVWHA